MSTYVPNPDDSTQPVDTVSARSMAAEFRALKGKVNQLTSAVAAWNPLDSAPGITLSNGDLLAEKTSADVVTNGVRATIGKTGAISYYFELTIGSAVAATWIGVGALNETVNNSISSFPGESVFSMGYCSNGQIWKDGSLQTTTSTFTTGDVVGCLFAPSGNVRFLKNGVFVGGTYAWNAGVTTLAKYPMAYFTVFGDYVIANFGATGLMYPSVGVPLYSMPTPLEGPQNLVTNPQFFVDQHNAHALVDPIATTSFAADCWRYIASVANKYKSQAVVSTAADILATGGSIGYLRMTTKAAYVAAAAEQFYFVHRIEGLKWAQLFYGSSVAQQSTLLFYFRTSLGAGLTFTGTLINPAANLTFPFNFTVTAANTWQRVAIPVPGCVPGAWVITSAQAVELRIDLGSGANFFTAVPTNWVAGQFNGTTGASAPINTLGATMDITGVEIKIGTYSILSPMETIDVATERAKCQRYYTIKRVVLFASANAVGSAYFNFAPEMRATPVWGSITVNANVNCTAGTPVALTSTDAYFPMNVTVAGDFNIDVSVDWSAEL